MIPVRTAVPDDAPELVRLREVMFEAMQGGMLDPDAPSEWKPLAERILRSSLAAGPDAGGGHPVFGIFVVDDAERPGRLAACAIGTLELRLPAPGHPDGLFGFVFNICTDPDRRRRGYARACTEALLAWFDEKGATRLDLHASADGQSLYRSLGFHEHSISLSRSAMR